MAVEVEQQAQALRQQALGAAITKLQCPFLILPQLSRQLSAVVERAQQPLPQALWGAQLHLRWRLRLWADLRLMLMVAVAAQLHLKPLAAVVNLVRAPARLWELLYLLILGLVAKGAVQALVVVLS